MRKTYNLITAFLLSCSLSVHAAAADNAAVGINIWNEHWISPAAQGAAIRQMAEGGVSCIASVAEHAENARGRSHQECRNAPERQEFVAELNISRAALPEVARNPRLTSCPHCSGPTRRGVYAEDIQPDNIHAAAADIAAVGINIWNEHWISPAAQDAAIRQMAEGGDRPQFRQNGMDKLVDGMHVYPDANPQRTVAARIDSLDHTIFAQCRQGGKPCWLTEWGIPNSSQSRPINEATRVQVINDLRSAFQHFVQQGLLAAIIYYDWSGEPSWKESYSVFRCGIFTDAGKLAIRPM